jgi:hypothetical protein
MTSLKSRISPGPHPKEEDLFVTSFFTSVIEYWVSRPLMREGDIGVF